MRTLPLVLLAVAALIAPTAALAGGATAPVSRTFVITGLVLGDQKAEVMGKLGIDGSQLYASVGCNMIGGKVSVDGDTITITEPLAMTEMACPGANGDLEAMLIKVLQHGPFTIGNGEWSGDGAQILVQELSSGVPDPNATPPDEPVGSSPGPVIIDPFFSCPPYPAGSGDPGVINGTVEPDGGPTDGSGTGSSDGATGSGGPSGSGGGPVDGSTSSGGGTDPSTGGGTEPSATGVAEPGATATTVEVSPAPPIDPAPGQTFDLGQPTPTAIDLPLPAPSEVVVEPAPSAVEMPDPGQIDPGFNGKPVPLDPCERVYAMDQANGAGSGAVPPKAGDAAAEHASLASSEARSLVLPLGAAGMAILLFGALAGRRLWTVRPVVARDAAPDAES